MSKTKSIAIIVLSLLLLCGIGFGIFFLLKNTTAKSDTDFALADAEKIQVEIENKTIDDFNEINFIGAKVDNAKSNFKNIIFANDEELRMKNITWNDILGEMVFNTEDGKIHSFCFTSNQYASVSDIAMIFDMLNKKFCESNKLSPSEIMITNGQEAQKFENSEDLYDTNQYLYVEYTINGQKIAIRTNCQNNLYVVTASTN